MRNENLLRVTKGICWQSLSNVGQPKDFPPDKIYWKKYQEKIHIDTINWEKLFVQTHVNDALVKKMNDNQW